MHGFSVVCQRPRLPHNPDIASASVILATIKNPKPKVGHLLHLTQKQDMMSDTRRRLPDCSTTKTYDT